jgi:hypothetical protein
VEQVYQIATKKDNAELTAFLTENGQALLPMVELIQQAQMAVEDFIGVLGRAALEAVLQLWAEQVAGPAHRTDAMATGISAIRSRLRVMPFTPNARRRDAGGTS